MRHLKRDPDTGLMLPPAGRRGRCEMFTAGPALWGGSLSDPYFSYVTTLLHGDGTNGSTSFPDNSLAHLTWSSSYGAIVSTAQYKFGNASMYFAGPNAATISTPYATGIDLIGNDFTIENWVRITTNRANGYRIFGTGGGLTGWNSTNGLHVLLLLTSTGALNLQLANGTSTPINITSSAVVTLSSFNFLSAGVAGSTAYLAVNGVVTSQTFSGLSRPSTNPFAQIAEIPGENSTAYSLNGYVDDFRLTNGIHRNPSVVPTGPFPNY